MAPRDFVIGVWQQPASSFQKWKTRGCNTLVDFPLGADRKPLSTSDRQAAFAVADEIGFRIICDPDPDDYRRDVGHLSLLAWMQKPDEPENWEHVKYKDAAGTRDFVRATADWFSRRSTLNGLAPSVPLFGNFNGTVLTSAWETWPANKPLSERNIIIPEYRLFMSQCDWVSADWHVINFARSPDQIVPLYRKMVERLRDFSGGKRVMAFIEASHQGLAKFPTGRAPTRAEMRAEIWTAIICGATGITYFPAKVEGGYVADAMTADLIAEMGWNNIAIASAQEWILNYPRSFTASGDGKNIVSTWKDSSGMGVTANVFWNPALNTWDTALSIPSELDALRNENKSLKSALAAKDAWYKQYPQ